MTQRRSRARDLNAPEHWLAWLRACQKSPTNPIEARGPLGMITGQDARALRAVAACWALYSGDDNARAGALAAVRALLPAMQRECWPFARELIAQQLDWSDRDRLWPLVLAPPGPDEQRARRAGLHVVPPADPEQRK